MLHHFGHRVVRGISVLRRTRWPTQPDAKENENASIMTGKQANGVRNLNTGAEIIALDTTQRSRIKGFKTPLFCLVPALD